MENQEIYCVIQDDYDHSTVCGLFADKQVAEEYAAQIGDYDLAIVSVKKLMTSKDLPCAVGMRGYEITMDKRGTVVCSGRCAAFDAQDQIGYICTKYDGNKGRSFYTGECCFIVATDKGEAEAVKIADQRRLWLINNNRWPESGKTAPDSYDANNFNFAELNEFVEYCREKQQIKSSEWWKEEKLN